MSAAIFHPSLADVDPKLRKELEDGSFGPAIPSDGSTLVRSFEAPGMGATTGFRAWRADGDGMMRQYAPAPMPPERAREADEAILGEFMERFFASNVLPAYPGGGPQITVDTALRFPNVILRALTDLTYLRFVADRILARGAPEQVAGGAAVFQRAETIFPDRGAEEHVARVEWPRSGWTVPDLFAAAVKSYGLEVPIDDLMRRRNAIDQLARAQRKLANAVVKFVDQTAMAMILADTAVNTYTAGALWSAAGAKIILDIGSARNLINNADLGYEMDTLIVNPAQELNLITDTSIQGVLPREQTPRNAAITGVPVPIVGLQQILVTNQMTAGKAIALNAGVVGSIADEQPRPEENYVGYDPGAGQANIFVKVYRNEDQDESIVRGARFPAMWIQEPRAATIINGI